MSSLYLGNAQVVADMPTPKLSDEIEALLIMAGVQVKYAGTYWLMHRKHEWGWKNEVPARADFEEWRLRIISFIKTFDAGQKN